MVIFGDQKPENRTRHHSARPQDTAPGVGRTTQAASADHDAAIAGDMPDIVDVVLEMGRAPEELSAEAPSPPLLVVSAPRLPAHLDARARPARG